MSTVFDNTSVGQRLAYDRETDSHFGEHPTVVGHKQRMAERIDADEKAHPDNVFGPQIAPGSGSGGSG